MGIFLSIFLGLLHMSAVLFYFAFALWGTVTGGREIEMPEPSDAEKLIMLLFKIGFVVSPILFTAAHVYGQYLWYSSQYDGKLVPISLMLSWLPMFFLFFLGVMVLLPISLEAVKG